MGNEEEALEAMLCRPESTFHRMFSIWRPRHKAEMMPSPGIRDADLATENPN